MNMSAGRIILGVGIVGAGGVGGWFAGDHWFKRPKTGAAVGVTVGIAVNYFIASRAAASTSNPPAVAP